MLGRGSRLASLALFAAACGTPDPPAPDPIPILSAPGPYAVGYRLYSVAYRPPLASADRRMSVHVWYPAEASEGERPIYTVLKSELATTDAPPLELGPRPVVVFSHGHQAYATVMSYLMEHLASHGYIAIAPTHTGNTFIDGADRQTDIYYQRSTDVKATLDWFQALSDDPLAGRGSDRIAMSGHSFGGYTAMALGGASYAVDTLHAACAAGTGSDGYCATLTLEKEDLFRAGFAEPRFSTLLSLDPGDFDLFGASGVAAIDLPVLHFVAERSGNPPSDPSADKYWSALHGAQDLRLLLLGGDHNDFTDSCAAGVRVRCSELDPVALKRAVRIYALAFLNQFLIGQQAPHGLLSGELPISDLFEPTKR